MRQAPNHHLKSSASLPNRKVAAGSFNVPVQSTKFNDDKDNRLNYFKQEKLIAGIHAADNYNYREAIKQFSLIKPDTATSLYLCGCARLELHYHEQSQEALKDFNKCIELLKNGERPPFITEIWYRRAIACHHIGKYEEAIEDYTEYINRCLASGEQAHKGLIGRGQTFQAMYDLDLAMTDMNEANALTNNRNPYYLCCRASVYASKSENKKASEDLEKASSSGCYQNPEALLQRGLVLAELNRHNAAIEDLKQALTLSAKPNQQSDICYRCGVSDYALNNKEQAEFWFSRAISLHPYHPEAYYYMGKIQSEKGHYKDALKSLNRAHELSPEQSDILYERAIVHENLGKLNEAAGDRKRARAIDMSEYAMITMLAKRIKLLREKIIHNDSSPLNHLELAMAYDALLTRKKNLTASSSYYKEAIAEYHAAIETDTKNLYPQARALRALCHQKMADIIEAHESHLEFYDFLDRNQDAADHWKAYLEDIKHRRESETLDPYIDQYCASRLTQMELNRKKNTVDIITYKNDIRDPNRNQLVFYQQMRYDLANILAAIAVLNLDRSVTMRNLENSSSRAAKIVELLSADESSIHNTESILHKKSKVNMKQIRNANYDIVKKRLNTLSNIGDMTDQLDIAQLVARHLCTRYRIQLISVRSDHSPTVRDTSSEVPVVAVAPSSWCCCGGGSKTAPHHEARSVRSPELKPTETHEIMKRISTFAIAYIIKTLNSETVRIAPNEKSLKKESIATSLVLMVSQAQLYSDTHHSTSSNADNILIPIDPSDVTEMLDDAQQLVDTGEHVPSMWNLYDFFRAPGIYYASDNDPKHFLFYGSSPSMMPHKHGYRLGTKEEVQLLRKMKQK